MAIAIIIFLLLLCIAGLVAVLHAVVETYNDDLLQYYDWDCPRCGREAYTTDRTETEKGILVHIKCPNCKYHEDILFKKKKEKKK